MNNKVVWCNNAWMPHHYGFCPNKKAWQTMCSRMRMSPEPYPTHAATTSLFKSKLDGKPVAVVTVQDFTPSITVNLLIHEAMHVWRDILENIGERSPSSEFEAYAMQNITAELFKAYEKTRGALFAKRLNRLRP